MRWNALPYNVFVCKKKSLPFLLTFEAVKYVDVILPLPLDGLFTYCVPTTMEDKLREGMRVIVPVGKSKRYVGIACRLHSEKPHFECRPVMSIPDAEPLVLPAQLLLWQWMSDYYMCPIGDIYKASLPITLRSMERERRKTERWAVLAASLRTEDDVFEALNQLSRSPQQRRLFNTFLHLTEVNSDTLPINDEKLRPAVSVDMLLNESNVSLTVLHSLVRRGFIMIENRECARSIEVSEGAPTAPSQPLSVQQQLAFDAIVEQWREHQVVLLRGVTSSGKTEVYIHLMEEALRRGEQVLYLLPEIALTVQITERLRRVFGSRLGIYHSRYTENERAAVWRKQCSDSPYDIIIGARSAVFIPFNSLGLIIVDEEHDANLHQSEPSPRYHARSVAIMMAHQLRYPRVLLGSATPCAESCHNAKLGKYGYVEMLTRFGNHPLPKVHIVDTKDFYRRKMMKGMFSPPLLSAMQAAFKRGRQAIVFHNRRGYAPVVECKDCGWIPHCRQCDVTLTLHRRSSSLTCHTCGSMYGVPQQCPECGGVNIRLRGYGSERVEDTILRLFPQSRVLRMDLDSTRSRQAYHRLLDQFGRGQSQILVGTQMVTKGLDFGGVDIVAILDADSMLSNPDFRSSEKAFAMMLQVSGRCGRNNAEGEVFLQTKNAGLDVIRQVAESDYSGFMSSLLDERKLFGYPPFVHLIYIYVRHRNESIAEQAACRMAQMLREKVVFPVLGPDKPSTGKVRMEHIRKVVLKADATISRSSLRDLLRQVRSFIQNVPEEYKGVTIYFEVDPQ